MVGITFRDEVILVGVGDPNPKLLSLYKRVVKTQLHTESPLCRQPVGMTHLHAKECQGLPTSRDELLHAC